MVSLERGEARWETSEEAGLMVQERDDVGFIQEIEHRGRELLFIVHLLCAGHCTRHFSSSSPFVLGFFFFNAQDLGAARDLIKLR